MKRFLLYIIIYCAIASNSFSQSYSYFNGKLIEANYIVLKLAPNSANDIESTKKFEGYLQSIGAINYIQKYAKAYSPERCKRCVDLTQVYEFYYTSNTNISEVLTFLNRLPIIEYAEPNYVHQLLAITDDTEMPQQWYMNTCGIYDAWDITMGDTNVVIGVVDAGFSITHNDLVTQIKYNYGDPINGFDDDYDGFIDNFRGWDFANRDNNPDIGVSDHGTYVAGLAAAKANNAFAIAGSGYNCKFLPIKIATDDGYIIRGYEGIVYAADQGANVINCSWGSIGSYSEYGQDVINYATFNRNALVIGAAGNSNNQGIFYPASFTNAFSIGGTINNDDKWGGSNYNYFVDICSPAGGYKSTAKNNSTTTMFGGTSFASPIVAGVAGLIKAKNPSYTALQIGEKLRVTTTDIYANPLNVQYNHLLGSGRLDAYSALIDSVKPSVRMTEFEVSNRTGQYMFYTGDTLELKLTLKNYLAPATNIFVTISCESSIIAPIENDTLIASFGANQEIQISIPFLFKIVNTLPPDVNTYFKITYNGSNYFGFEYFPISFNPSYYDFEYSNFKATATADGTIAILNPSNNKAYGLIYKNNPNMIYEGGLILAQKNNTFIKAANFTNHNDFTIDEFPTTITSDSTDVLISSKYTSSELDLDVEQFIYGWNDKDIIIHEYRITNNTDSIIHNLYAGPYIDWQISNQIFNKVDYIDTLQLSTISTIDPEGFYAGIMPLHYHQSNIYAIDDVAGKDTVLPNNGLTLIELEYAVLNTKIEAGKYASEGGPIATLNSCVIGELKPDSVAIIRYAIIAGETIEDVYSTAISLKQNYVTDTTTGPNISITNLDSESITIFETHTEIVIQGLSSLNKGEIRLIDALGKNVLFNSSQSSKATIINKKQFANGMYTVLIEQDKKIVSQKIVVLN